MFDKFNNTLTIITGSFGEAAQEMAILLDLSKRFGINFEAAAIPFTKFMAAAQGMMSLDSARKVFEAFAAASSSLQLNYQEIQGIFLAVQQIASKGVVSMEELRLQLAERIPGAMTLAAKAWGVTYAEFERLVTARLVPAGSFLIEFSKVLTDRFGRAAVQASMLAANAFNRLKTNLLEFVGVLARSGFMDSLSRLFDVMSSWLHGNRSLAQTIGSWLADLTNSITAFVSNTSASDVYDLVMTIVEAFKMLTQVLNPMSWFRMIGDIFANSDNKIMQMVGSIAKAIGSVFKDTLDAAFQVAFDHITGKFEALNAKRASRALTIDIAGSNQSQGQTAEELWDSDLIDRISQNIISASEIAVKRRDARSRSYLDELRDANLAIEKQYDLLTRVGVTLEEQQAAADGLRTVHEAQADIIDKVVKLNQRLIPDLRTNTDKIADFRAYLEDLASFGDMFIDKANIDLYVELFAESIGEMGSASKRFLKDLKAGFESWGETVADTFARITVTGEGSWRDIRIAFQTELVKMLSYRFIFEQLFSTISGAIPTTSGRATRTGSGGPVLNPHITEIAGSGMAFNNGQKMQFATGGVINGRITFPMVEAGERGPEAILPLKRNSSGNLGVSAEGAAQTEVRVYDMRGAGDPPVEVRETSDGGRRQIEVMIKSAISNAIENGSLDRTMARTYGLNRRPR